MLNEQDIASAWDEWMTLAGSEHKHPDATTVAPAIERLGVNPHALARRAEVIADEASDRIVFAHRRLHGTWLGPREMFTATFMPAFIAGFIAGRRAGRRTSSTVHE